jgi:hypothetical protein
MAKKHMKKSSTSLAIGEIQIKTMLRFCPTPLKMLSSSTQTIKMSMRMWGERNPHTLLVGM